MEKQNKELTETRHIFVVAKIKVQSPVELVNDFEMFKLRWKRTATEALQTVGEVRIVDILT